MRKFLPFIALFSSVFGETEEIELKLNKPIFKKDSATCYHGGVIKTEDITIYAKELDYKKENDEHSLYAKGHLLIKFGRYIIIGDSLYYNFNEKRGYIQNGVGTVNNIIAGGKKIYLFEDGSLEIEEAFATPSPSIPPIFEITSPKITVNKNTRATAKTMVGKFNGIPFMWLPSYGMTLDPKYKRKPSIFYTMRLEQDQLPIFIGRYKMYDDDLLQAFARLEYRPLFLREYKDPDDENKKFRPQVWQGIGGALDLDFKSENGKITFQTRNFASYNVWYLNQDPNKIALRYRIQGKYKGVTEDDSVESFVQWDRLSDRFMRSYFPTQIFDIGTLYNNEAYVKYRTDPAYVSIYAKPRLNEFRGFKQQLPSFNIAVRPIELFDTKCYLEQSYNASYLRYLYALQIIDLFSEKILIDFGSGRFSSNLNLYRPFNFGPLNITPRVGFDGICYTENQNNNISWQGVCTYGGDSNMEFKGEYDTLSHYIKPYVKYNGLTAPTSQNNEHYIFNIDDGYATYNQLIFGLNNEIYFNRFPVDEPTVTCNLSAMRFFFTNSFVKPLSKADIKLTWHYPRMELGGKFGWNFEKDTYDYYNINFGWTINDYFALSSDFYDRGPFWWRKDNHENFILDSFRLIDEMDQTPLSDARYCIVNKIQLQIAPLWTLQIQNNTGKRDEVINDLGVVVREPEPFYQQTKLSLSMLLSNSYRINLNYTFANDDQNNYFGFTFDIL